MAMVFLMGHSFTVVVTIHKDKVLLSFSTYGNICNTSNLRVWTVIAQGLSAMMINEQEQLTLCNSSVKRSESVL